MYVPAHEQVGYSFAAWQTVVDDERQGRFHKAAAIDSTLFSGMVDVSVLSNDCLHGARPREALGAKRLHIGVRVRQVRPVLLGEDLNVEGQVTAIRPVRRGRYIEVAFQFRASDGSVPVEIDHKSLILDAAPLPAASGPKPRNMEIGGFDVLRQVSLTPEMVRGYSYEFLHLAAHHDPEAAAAIGMRAPIAQGLMGFGLLFQECVRDSNPETFDIEARFKRPIFWDDVLSLEMARGREFRARNAQEKTVSELSIYDWN